MADIPVTASNIQVAPKDYTLPGSQEFLLKAVRAVVDGSGSTVPFVPVLQLLTPDGTVMWDAPASQVTAGASVAVSWFPDVETPSTTSTATITSVTSSGASIAVTNGSGPAVNVDVAPSGVTGGSYGDATHVGSFTVGNDGRLTAASNVLISGGGAGTGLVKLFDSTLAAPAASIDTGAGGIAAGHGTLLVYFMGQTSDAGAAINVDIRVNNDAAANYDAQVMYENNITLGNGTALATNQWKLIGHGAGGSANYPGHIAAVIPAYDNTTFWKTGTVQHGDVDATQANCFVAHYAIGWRSTAAISRLSVFPDSGLNIATGSRLMIYGTQ